MKKANLYYFTSLLILVLIYITLSHFANNELMFPDLQRISEYVYSLKLSYLLKNILMTIIRALISYFIALLSGLILAFISSYRKLYYFISPYISILKTIPTISVIILSFIWLGKDYSLYLIAVLVILPVFYELFYHHISSPDSKLLEVSVVYRFSRAKKFKYIYFYGIIEDLMVSLKQTFGLCFKIIVMAEVITQADIGIGARIRNDLTLAEISGVFAWTMILIILVLLIDFIIMKISKSIVKWK